jgi:hypothetical protein
LRNASRSASIVSACVGPLSAKWLTNGTLKTYKDFPHGMPTTAAIPGFQHMK